MTTRHKCVLAAGPGREPARSYTSDLEYLADEMRWIEARCSRISDAANLHLLREGRAETASTPREDEGTIKRLTAMFRVHSRQERALRARMDRRLARARNTGFRPALCLLAETCGLSAPERTTLLLALAPAFSTTVGDLLTRGLGVKNASAVGVSVEGVFRFLEFTMEQRIAGRRMFSRNAPLVKNDLIRLKDPSGGMGPAGLLAATVIVPPRIVQYLMGDSTPGEEYQDFSSVEEPRATFDQLVIDDADRERILSIVDHHDQYLRCRAAWGFDRLIRYGRGAMMLFHGKPGTGKTLAAHAIAHRMGKKILLVEIPAFLRGSDIERKLSGLFREARLMDAVLFFDECEAFFQDRALGNRLMAVLLTELERFEGFAILATNAPERLDRALDRRMLVRVSFPEPDRDARLAIWRKHIPAEAPVAPDVDLAALAAKYPLTGGLIKNAVLMAVAEAFREGGESATIRMANLERAASDQLRTSGDALFVLRKAQARMADLVLPDDLCSRVNELISAARTRSDVLHRWGIGRHLSRGKGVSALMTGDPGTGKTLCAEAVAGELGRPFLCASVPEIVSMWVGETEKNLSRLFRYAAATGAVLFLDECDSLLAARDGLAVRGHDLKAVNVLLDQIERHEGVVLLATNFPGILDRALRRRIVYHLVFPMPNAAQRAKIWRGLVPDSAPLAPDVDFNDLGRRFEISGGHIKNAVFKAAFRAAEAATAITQGLLAAAAREELEAAAPRKRVGFTATPTRPG